MTVIGTLVAVMLLRPGCAAEHLGSTGLMIAGWVRNLTPMFVAPLLILGIWNGSVSVLLGGVEAAGAVRAPHGHLPAVAAFPGQQVEKQSRWSWCWRRTAWTSWTGQCSQEIGKQKNAGKPLPVFLYNLYKKKTHRVPHDTLCVLVRVTGIEPAAS